VTSKAGFPSGPLPSAQVNHGPLAASEHRARDVQTIRTGASSKPVGGAETQMLLFTTDRGPEVSRA